MNTLTSTTKKKSTPYQQPPTTAICDSGATETFIRYSDINILTNYTTTPRPISVHLPNGNSITSIGEGYLHIHPDLPHIHVYIFKDSDLSQSLISIADICNTGCDVTFTATNVTITQITTKRIIYTAPKPRTDKLWGANLHHLSAQPQHVPLNPILFTKQHSSHAAIHHQINAEFVAYTSASLGNPPTSTLIRALQRGYLRSLPRLTHQMVTENPPTSMATAKGHLDLHRTGVQSTTKPRRQRRKKHAPPPLLIPTTSDLPSLLPQPHSLLEEGVPHTNNLLPDDEPTDTDAEHSVLLAITDTSDLALHADLTGRFPVTSRHGNAYILVSTLKGYIHLEPIASRQANDYTTAVRKTLEFFRNLGHHPSYFRIDNETSKQLERLMHSERITIEYVPPNNHRANKAERAIRSAKNHIIASLSSVHPSCPLLLWDDFLPQIEITLNLLRPATNYPNISAYQAIYGKHYNFKAHPIAPVGTQVLSHDPPQNRPSWAPHGTPGFYLGPSLQHYRSYRIFIPSTMSDRITDTVEWLPVPFYLPGSTTAELVIQALQDTQTMLHPTEPQSTAADPSALARLTDTLHGILQVLTSDPRHKLTSPAPPSSPTPPTTTNQTILASPNIPVSSPQPLHSDSGVTSLPTSPPPGLLPKQTHPPDILPIPLSTPPDPVPRTEPLTMDTPPIPPTPTDPEPPSTRSTRQRKRPQRYRGANHTRHSPTPQPSIVESSHYAHTAVTMDTDGTPLTYRKAKNGPHRDQWAEAEHEELVRLIVETKTMNFIPRHAVPHDRKVSYYNPQVKIKDKNGTITFRVRGTYGGDLSDYPYSVTAFTADLQTIKILLNSVVTDNDNFMTCDVKDFYLGTILPHKEYMRIHRSQIPHKSEALFQLDTLWDNNYVYVEITKGIYGLPQAGKLAQDRLVAHLRQHGYHSSPESPCLFRHEHLPISFVLVVDDFGIKFRSPTDAQHLLGTLRKLYTITEDWSGTKYVGLTINHNRAQRTLSLSIPGYVQRACLRFGIDTPTTPVSTPMVYVSPKHGVPGPQPVTLDHPDPDDRPLTPDEHKRLQQILGVFLFYARAVDYTLLTTLSKLSSQQSSPRLSTLDAAHRLIRYAASYPDASVTYYPSTMQLHLHSDASYLSEREARSRCGGIFFLPRLPQNTPLNPKSTQPPLLNGMIDVHTTIIRSVVASTCEAEYAALFMNCQHAVSLRRTLTFLGYPQLSTPIASDNECAVNIANYLSIPQKSKAMNMRYHWVRDRVREGEFKITWAPGDDNLADFFTKIVPSDTTAHMRQLLAYPLRDSYPVIFSSVPLVQEGVLDQRSTRHTEPEKTRDTNGIHPNFISLDID